MVCGIEFVLGVNNKKEFIMRILLFVLFVSFGFEVIASDCANGRCGLQPIRSSAKLAGEVVGEVYSVTKSVTKTALPPYNVNVNKRCRNGKCRR